MPRCTILLGPVTPRCAQPPALPVRPAAPRKAKRKRLAAGLSIDFAESMKCTQQIQFAVEQGERVRGGEPGRFRRTYVVAEAAAEVIAERFELVCQRLGWTCETYADVLASVMPEYYADPELAKIVSDRPKGTAGRVAEYAARVASGKAVRHPGDKEPDLLGLVNLNLGGRINRDRFRVAAWEGDPADN